LTGTVRAPSFGSEPANDLIHDVAELRARRHGIDYRRSSPFWVSVRDPIAIFLDVLHVADFT
jgi:hypothetical protein